MNSVGSIDELSDHRLLTQRVHRLIRKRYLGQLHHQDTMFSDRRKTNRLYFNFFPRFIQRLAIRSEPRYQVYPMC